jgi:predicted nucleic acid-binding Zn ribbon protein
MALNRNIEPKKIGKISSDMAGNPAISSVVLLSKLNSIWPAIVGPYISKHTKIKSIRFRKLEITTEIAPIRTEILARKDEIIQKINLELGVEKITDLSVL